MAVPHEEHEGWVPVERRWLGLDRRTIVPALVVLVLGIVLANVIPAINGAIAYDDEVRAGDVIGLKAGVRFVPTPGWGITEGRRVGDETRSRIFTASATVEEGDVAFVVRTAPFAGDANALLEQLEEIDDKLRDDRGVHTTGEAHAIATNSGINGVLKRYTGTKTDGLLAAFVVDGTGVQVVLAGPPGELDEPAADVGRMIASITHESEEGSP